YLDNKYGMSDVYAGAPVILGKNGVEKVLEISLNEQELKAYQTSLSQVKKGIDETKDLI
ncbi:MAG: malate dehydrogenase, partial [Candidatus Heimdallarchaeota archaeon]